MTFRDAMLASLDKSSRAVVYAELDVRGCKAELKKRDLPVAPVKTAVRGVINGVRVTGPMNGVRVVAPGPPTKFGVLDCRLALALDDLTKLLGKHEVVALRIDNFYRQNARLAGRRKPSQHAYGLAIDLTNLTLASGKVLETSMWGAEIGDVPCGPAAVMKAPTADAITLRNLICAVGRTGLFHTILTPSFNAAHQSHFHLDIKRESSFVSVR